MNAHAFLVALTIVLGVAAVTTVVFQRLRQPVVLGYILAGVIVGPNVPIPLVADRAVIETLSELGVILLVFSLGLGFSLGKLVEVGPTAGLTALLQSSLMVWLGFVAGRLFGWTTLESLFAGAIIAISSTTIIAKAFDEQQLHGPLRELVVGALIVEDLIAILLMATLTAVASGAGLSARDMAATTGKLVLFLVGLVSLGLVLVPRGVRAIKRLGRPETTLVASIGFCFGLSLLAHELGYSVALGAFLAGSLIAESGEHQDIEHLVQPVRDIFAAIFFVSVGVLIDPALIARHWLAIAVFTALVVVGKLVGVSLGAFLTGNSVRTSVQAGMSLAQIGEFSFIIAALGLSLRATGDFLYPIAVAVSALTTLTTPWLIKASGPVASLVDRALPRPLQTFVALYASWIEQLRHRPKDRTRGATLRRLLRLLVLDAVLLVALAVGTSWGLGRMTAFLSHTAGLGAELARGAVLVAALALAIPLGAGVVRVARRLGLTVAEAVLPAVAAGKVDLAAAPRRALVVTLQLAIVLLTGLPILAVTQPVLGGVYGALVLAALLVGLGGAFWRGATNLHGHVEAGAQVIVAARRSPGSTRCCPGWASRRRCRSSPPARRWGSRPPSSTCAASLARRCWPSPAAKRGCSCRPRARSCRPATCSRWRAAARPSRPPGRTWLERSSLSRPPRATRPQANSWAYSRRPDCAAAPPTLLPVLRRPQPRGSHGPAIRAGAEARRRVAPRRGERVTPRQRWGLVSPAAPRPR